MLIVAVSCSIALLCWSRVMETSDFYDDLRKALRHERTRERATEAMIARDKMHMLALLFLAVTCAVFITFHFAV